MNRFELLLEVKLALVLKERAPNVVVDLAFDRSSSFSPEMTSPINRSRGSSGSASSSF